MATPAWCLVPLPGPVPTGQVGVSVAHVKAAARPYRMTARAEQAAATGERILEAATALFWERPAAEISLDAVAERAGVSVQTVIRRFGGRDGLFREAADRQRRAVADHRDRAPVGDVAAAVAILLDHYEDLGDGVLRLLAAAHAVPALAEVVDAGRRYHHEWCERTFAPALAGRERADRLRTLAQIVAVCDVYTWQIMRRDLGLSRQETERAVVELLEPLTREGR